jgi:hypothetical protein
MTTHTVHPLADDYLKRLRRAGRGLPRTRLAELVDEIEEHLSEAIRPEASDAEALTVLDRLGEPEAIIEAEEPRRAAPPDRRGTREWAAIILLLFGGFIFGIGWIAGLILLWSSRAWTTVDKVIGTLVIPGGLATVLYVALFAASSTTSSSSPSICFAPTAGGLAGHCSHATNSVSGRPDILGIALFAVLVLAPFATAVYLARRAR